MATHSSILAWRIPGTESLVGCHLWGCTEADTHRIGHSSSSSSSFVNNAIGNLLGIALNL